MSDFNHIVQSNIPKKLTTPHLEGVAVAVEETRSLSCKNTDNKINCKCMANALMPTVMRAANSSHKGFIAGRHFTDNILVVDAIMRVYSNLHHKYGQSIAAFFDFSNAFPSVSLQWIFLVLKWLKLPRGVINFFEAIYHDVHCFIKHAGQLQYMCVARSGVLQGCRLAALLFVLAMEPFCCLFNSAMCDRGVVELCADDIAIVFKSWFDMPIVYNIFELAKQ
eukprot:10326108-Karenia_brevis.AAC.1